MNASTLTTLPVGDADGAKASFQELLNQNVVLFVVFGDSDEDRTFKDKVVSRASDPNQPWRVVWAREPSSIELQLRALDNADELPNDLADARGCTTSFGDRLVAVFLRANPALNSLNVTTALVAAGGAS